MNLAFRVAVLKIVKDYVSAMYDEVRVEAAKELGQGDRMIARSPLDTGKKLAAVWVTDPKPVARIVDQSAFDRWLTTNYPEHMKATHEIIGSDKEIADVLFEHAPHLLRTVRTPDPDVVRKIKTESAALGCPVGPGGEVDVDGLEVAAPEGSVTCKAEDGALATVIDLFQSGHLTFETMYQPELPGGAE